MDPEGSLGHLRSPEPATDSVLNADPDVSRVPLVVHSLAALRSIRRSECGPRPLKNVIKPTLNVHAVYYDVTYKKCCWCCLAKGYRVANWREVRTLQQPEVCTGRNFRISPGPAREATGPSPKFIYKYVTRTPPKPDFLLFQPEWSPIYLQSALTIIS
jgi:hypothetical protein